MRLALDPLVIAVLLLAAAAYLRAIAVLRGRGVRVPAARQACWWTGLALLAAGLIGPAGAYADELLSAHMAEHLLIGDLAAPFLVAGVRSPVLLFLLPRPALVSLAHRRGLRRAFRWIRRPLPALAIYLIVLFGWHLPVLFEAALRSPLVHALQHQSFLAANILIWWVVLEPQRMRLPADLWKIGYVFATRMVSMLFGMAVIVARSPLYGAYYGDRPRRYGVAPLADQRLGFGAMMVVDIVLIMGTLAFLFWHAAQEADDEPAPAPLATPGAGAGAGG